MKRFRARSLFYCAASASALFSLNLVIAGDPGPAQQTDQKAAADIAPPRATMEQREAVEASLEHTNKLQQSETQAVPTAANDSTVRMQPLGSGGVAPILKQTGDVIPGPGPETAAPILDANSARISFQAVLTDNLGNALLGPVNLRFQIYTHPGGVAVGAAIDVNGVTLNNGIADTQVPVPATSFDGTGRAMGVRVNLGVELTPRIQLTATPYAYRVDRVASAELDDTIALGTTAACGNLDVYRTSSNTPGISLDGCASAISTFGSDGLEQIRLHGSSWGEIWLNDTTGNDRTVFISATLNAGGLMQLTDAGGVNSAQLNGFTGRADVKDGYYAVSAIGGIVEAKFTGGTGGNLRTYNSAGTTETSVLGTSAGSGGFMQLKQANGTLGMNVDGDAGTNNGGVLNVYQADAGLGVTIDGASVGTGGEVAVFDANSTETVEILGSEDSATGAQIAMRRADGTASITLDAEFGSAGEDARIDVTGRIATSSLQITGGADLSEQFEISTAGGSSIEPGMVVSIDPTRPGELAVARSAYDHKVAGIISGAGGVKTGLVMGQKGTEADGKHSVALTGRVYCHVDANYGAIEVGDLLTSSSTPGHAMKVSDPLLAQGAIIGKAMTPLKQGKGLVLVLVSLQ